MITLAEYVVDKLGAMPALPFPRARCPGCRNPEALFALTKAGDALWRCGSCRIDIARATTPPFQVSWDDIRGERNVELERTDKYELASVRARTPPEELAAWDAYRQAWRDITLQECAPQDAVRPAAPNFTTETP